MYFKSHKENSLKFSKKQKTICSRLYIKERKKFFNDPEAATKKFS